MVLGKDILVSLSVVVAEIVFIKSLCDDPDKFVSDVVGEEVAEIHNGSVVFSGEPGFLLAFSVSADIAIVSTRNLLSSAIVLPKTIFKKGL